VGASTSVAEGVSEETVNTDLAHHVRNKYFGDLTQRRTMLISQLPLTAALVFVTAILAAVSPHIFGSAAFRSSLILALAILILCAFLPWNLLPARSFVVVPLLDFLVIALAREAAAESITSLGLLLVFPVIWLAAALGRKGVLLSAAGTLLVVAVPLFAGASATPADAVRPFLLPAIMTVIALAVHILVSSIASQDARLRAKDAELRRSYEESLERQRLLDTMLETVGVGVHAVDAAGHDILMNEQHRRHRSLAAPTGEPETAEPDLNILASDGITPVPAEHRPVARATLGQSFSDYHIRIGSPPDQRVLSSTARAMKDRDGNFAGSVVAFGDVTDLVNALALKDDFVANISHEFRTPLMSILGYLDLALDGAEDTGGQHERFLEMAQRNAERLLGLVSELLTGSSDSLGVHPQKMDLGDLVRRGVASAKPRADARWVAIVNEVSGALWITADPERLTQVLENLLTNAIKYSQPGDVVTIRAWDTVDQAYFSVTDTGMGISEQDLPHIFTRYYRSSHVRESAISGVGLGLGIVKRIVENHGGSVSVSSKPDLGSTFTVRLPKTSQDMKSSTPPMQGPAGVDTA
jgi:signal transduction histidine kinase